MLSTIIKRPVTVIMVFIAVSVFGLISFKKLLVNLLPDIKYPSVTIWTEYPGNSPEEVEKEITGNLEAFIGAVNGIKEISSSSKNGISLIRVNFDWGVDMDFAVLQLREKLDGAGLPEAAGRPNIIRIDPAAKPVLGISVSGENLYNVRNTSEQVIKRRLEQIEGVALADVVGGEEKEIRVEIDIKKMNKYGITFNDISTAIRSANIEQTGGTIKDDVYLYDLRISSQFESLKDIENTLIRQQQNYKNIFIKDIASVQMKEKEKTAFTRFNGRESVGILVRKDADANAVVVSRRVGAVLEQISSEYGSLSIRKAFDQADFIQESIDNVVAAVLLGGILAFLTLFLFIRDFKAPANIALSIPISIMATFALIYFSGISLNLMSMSGLALGVGMLVDNSIVILENIMRHKEMGKKILQASIDGTKEVAMPVSASTLTTIIVFMPIVFMTGIAGSLFKDQSVAVAFSLFSSLVVSLTLLPVIASKMNLDFIREGGLDHSIKSVHGKFYRTGTYWFVTFVLAYLVFMFEELPNEFRYYASFFSSAGETPDKVSIDIPTYIYLLFLALIINLAIKFGENFIRLRKLKKNSPEIYGQQGGNLRSLLVTMLSLSVILLLTLPAVYMTRVDLFEALYRILNLFNLEFVDEYVFPPLYDFSSAIKEFFQPYEEELGTDKFTLVVYLLGGITFILNLFEFFTFNFLRKIRKEDASSNMQVLNLRELLRGMIGKVLKFSFGLFSFWLKGGVKGVKVLVTPLLLLFDLFFERFKRGYHFLLLKALDHRGATLAIVFVMLIVTVIAGVNMEKRLMPNIDSGEFILDVELSPGASLEKTEYLIRAYERIILQDSLSVASVYSSGGIPDEKSKISGSTIYKGQLQVVLQKGVSTFDFVNVLRDRIASINEQEAEEIKINYITEVSTLSDFMKTDDADIAVKVYGNDLADLEDVSLAVIKKLETIDNLSEIKSNYVSRKPKIELSFNVENMKHNNISPGEIESYISTLVKGEKASEFNDFDRKIDIIMTQQEEKRNNLRDVFTSLYTRNGVGIPIGELVSYEYKEGPEAIEREDQQRVITIRANIRRGDFDKVIATTEAAVRQVQLFKGQKIEVGGQNAEMESSFSQLLSMFALSILLVYMVLASQFESLLSPFIIMFAVPLSVFGVVFGLGIFGMSINVMSMIGLIMLIGIVVNDAIVKVDFIDREVRNGKGIRAAIIEAGNKRLRPILMTTISTVFGMIPMAVAWGGSSELRKPLAITVIFGLSFATLLTLIVIPVIYSLLKKEPAPAEMGELEKVVAQPEKA